MLSVHIENIGELAVIECEGRIVRSEAAFKLREAANSERDARIIVRSARHRRQRYRHARVFCSDGLTTTTFDLSCSIPPICAGQAGQRKKGGPMQNLLNIIWSDEGQDIAEYAVMLAVILVLVIGTIRLVGSNANNVFSAAASSIQ